MSFANECMRFASWLSLKRSCGQFEKLSFSLVLVEIFSSVEFFLIIFFKSFIIRLILNDFCLVNTKVLIIILKLLKLIYELSRAIFILWFVVSFTNCSQKLHFLAVFLVACDILSFIATFCRFFCFHIACIFLKNYSERYF